MKRLSAIGLSLVFLAMQTIAQARLSLPDAPVRCTCCSCQDGRCCVGESSPADSQPLPLAPTSAAAFNLHPIILAASLAWSLPSAEAEVFSAASLSSPSAARVPLFQRDCALLI